MKVTQLIKTLIVCTIAAGVVACGDPAELAVESSPEVIEQGLVSSEPIATMAVKQCSNPWHTYCEAADSDDCTGCMRVKDCISCLNDLDYWVGGIYGVTVAQ